MLSRRLILTLFVGSPAVRAPASGAFDAAGERLRRPAFSYENGVLQVTNLTVGPEQVHWGSPFR